VGKHHAATVLGFLVLVLWRPAPVAQGGPLRFAVTVPISQGTQPLDGRLLVMLAKDPRAGLSAVASAKVDEPRFQINDSVSGQLIFGVDVDGLKPGSAATLDGSAIGFPLESINDIPAERIPCRR
jgi:hypothetical protein